MRLLGQRLETARPPVPAAERLAGSTIWTYCVPALGFQLMGSLFVLYLMKFSTDVLLIAPAAMGLIFGVGRIWDAVSDPLVGFLSDRTTARSGRRRSWMFASAVPIGVAMVLLWSPPPALAGAALVVWMAFAYLLYETATTAFFVPWGALGVELTPNYHERTRLFGYRHIILGAGGVVGLSTFELLRRAEDQRTVAFAISLFAGVIIAGSILWAASRLRERVDFQGRGAASAYQGFADVFRNRHSRLLLIVFAVETFGAASLSMLAIYVMEYVVKAPELTIWVALLSYVPNYAFAPLWMRLAHRYGKKAIWLFSMSLSTIGFFGFFFVNDERILYLLGLALILGAAGGCGAVVAPAVQADVVDYDEFLTGERKEGAYLAVWNLIRKGAGGVTAMATGFVLQWVSFEPNAEQSPETKTAMLALISLLPGTCFLIGTLLFTRFGLNEAEHAAIRPVLEARRRDRLRSPGQVRPARGAGS